MGNNPVAKLVIYKDGKEQKTFLLESNEINIGRWDPDSGSFPEVDLTDYDYDTKISRKHAKIIVKGDQFFLEDLGSLNGTYINRGKRLSPGKPQPIKNEDELIIGKTFTRLFL